MDIDKSDMIGFSLLPVSGPVPDPVRTLHAKFVVERELVHEGGRRTAKNKTARVPAKWDGDKQQTLENGYWHHLRRRRR